MTDRARLDAAIAAGQATEHLPGKDALLALVDALVATIISKYPPDSRPPVLRNIIERLPRTLSEFEKVDRDNPGAPQLLVPAFSRGLTGRSAFRAAGPAC